MYTNAIAIAICGNIGLLWDGVACEASAGA